MNYKNYLNYQFSRSESPENIRYTARKDFETSKAYDRLDKIQREMEKRTKRIHKRIERNISKNQDRINKFLIR